MVDRLTRRSDSASTIAKWLSSQASRAVALAASTASPDPVPGASDGRAPFRAPPWFRPPWWQGLAVQPAGGQGVERRFQSFVDVLDSHTRHCSRRGDTFTWRRDPRSGSRTLRAGHPGCPAPQCNSPEGERLESLLSITLPSSSNMRPMPRRLPARSKVHALARPVGVNTWTCPSRPDRVGRVTGRPSSPSK